MNKEESIITEEDYENIRVKTMKFLESKGFVLIATIVAVLGMLICAWIIVKEGSTNFQIIMCGIIFIILLAIVMFLTTLSKKEVIVDGVSEKEMETLDDVENIEEAEEKAHITLMEKEK